MVSQKEIDETYSKYKDKTNMSYTELLIWSKNPASKLASLDRSPIRRNLRLLKKPKKDWTALDVKEVSGKLSKRDISLLNWAFNPFK